MTAAKGAVLCAFWITGVAGCGSTLPFVWVHDLPASESSGDQLIQARDTILVDVRDHLPLSGEYLVRDDGHYLHPTLGSVRVEGINTMEAARLITMRLKGVVVDPRVQVWITRTAPARVHVVGEVKTPGTYDLTRDKGLVAALSAAGWVNEFARKDGIYVVRTGATQQRIRFRLKDLASADSTSVRFRLRDGDSVMVE